MKRLAMLATAVALLALVAIPAGSSAGPQSFVVDDECDGFGAFVPADRKAVRDIVPGEFKLRTGNEVTGKTDVLVSAFICREVEIDGIPVRKFLYSNVTANIESHGGGGYDIWQFTDLLVFQSRLTAIGISAPLLKNMSVKIKTVAGAPVAGSADIPWPESPYEIDAVIGLVSAPLLAVNLCEEGNQDGNGCFPSDHWFKGPYGTVYAAHSNCEFEASPAMVTISAEPGSPLARMLGGEEFTLPGFRGRADITALWDFREAFDKGQATRPECATDKTTSSEAWISRG